MPVSHSALSDSNVKLNDNNWTVPQWTTTATIITVADETQPKIREKKKNHTSRVPAEKYDYYDRVGRKKKYDRHN